MANTHTTLTSLFSDIAGAIREKKGTTGAIVADNFPAEIRSISGGGGDVTAVSGVVTLSSSNNSLYLDQLGMSIPDALKPNVKGFLVYLTGIEDTGVGVSIAGAIISISCTFDNEALETKSCYITYVDGNGHIANAFYLPNQPIQDGYLQYCESYYDYTYDDEIYVSSDLGYLKFASNLPYQVVLYS